jgi:hypothetical protein
MCATPSAAMLEACTGAGLLGLLYKLLNCRGPRPLALSAAVQAHTGAAADGESIGHLLAGAQKCALRALPPARRSCRARHNCTDCLPHAPVAGVSTMMTDACTR